jgi:hypothetical protein
MVEANRDVAGDFDVLSLIIADGDFLCVIEQDVRGLEGRIGEESSGDEVGFLLRGLVLELRHSAEFAKTHGALHDPAELGVLWNVRLHEDGGNLGIEPDRKQHCREIEGVGPERAGGLRHGEGMQIDDAVEHVTRMLARYPIP